jgi:DNA-binding CsgD family transcriptional regulator
VVELLVREGLGDADIAGRLSLSPRTVERHLGDAYRVARAHWDLPVVNRAQLVALLHLYYALKG